MSGSAGNAVVAIAEPDYAYGTGVLYLKIEKVDRANLVRYENEPWLWVEGVQVTAAGAVIGPRRVLVRARRLPTDRR